MGERLSQEVALLGTIDPSGIASGTTYSSDVIDAQLYNSLMFVYSLGNITSSGVVTLKAKKGTVTTTMTSTITSTTLSEKDDNKQWVVDIDVDAEGSRYYQFTAASNAGTATGACFHSAVLLGGKTRYHPATDNDLSSATVTVA